jgi:erythromycin esterase-like protein
MKEFILVEFIATHNDREELIKKVSTLGDDFQQINQVYSSAITIYGKISSEYASIIKIQDQFLSERMHISYIPDDMKDKYRK